MDNATGDRAKYRGAQARVLAGLREHGAGRVLTSDDILLEDLRMIFSIGQGYMRRQVQELIGVPEERRGGHWQNGYLLYDNQLYIFCNVGAPGRTGHDYDNRWEGEELLWTARTGATLEQPLMRQIAANAFPIHIFTRTDNERADFTYHGVAKTLSSQATVPATFRFGFQQGEDTEVRKLGSVLAPDARLWAKSEFGPVHDGWPALSFSSHKIAAEFANDFRREHDYVVYIGTTDPDATLEAGHRSRLLSAVTTEPRAPRACRWAPARLQGAI